MDRICGKVRQLAATRPAVVRLLEWQIDEALTRCYPDVTPAKMANFFTTDNLFCLNDLSGGEGQNRTVDTTIFSRMLYQLSYLATRGIARTVEPKS